MKALNSQPEGERQLLTSMILYTIVDLAPVDEFTEERPPENEQYATKIWKSRLARHEEATLNHITAMAFAVNGEPLILGSGRSLTFNDCLIELGLDNVEEIVERIRQQPHTFGKDASKLLKEALRGLAKTDVAVHPQELFATQSEKESSLGF